MEKSVTVQEAQEALNFLVENKSKLLDLPNHKPQPPEFMCGRHNKILTVSQKRGEEEYGKKYSEYRAELNPYEDAKIVIYHFFELGIWRKFTDYDNIYPYQLFLTAYQQFYSEMRMTNFFSGDFYCTTAYEHNRFFEVSPNLFLPCGGFCEFNFTPERLQKLQEIGIIEYSGNIPFVFTETNKQLLRVLLTHPKICNGMRVSEVERITPAYFIDKKGNQLNLAKNNNRYTSLILDQLNELLQKW